MKLNCPESNIGMLRGNPEACPTNFFRMTSCGCSPVKQCLYSYKGTDVAIGDALTGLILGESVHTGLHNSLTYEEETITIDPAPTDVEAMRQSFAEAIGKYVNGVLTSFYFNEAGEFCFEYIGSKELKEIHFGATIIEPEVLCDTKQVCTFQILASDVIPSINGSTDLSNNPYPYDVAVAANNDDTAALLETDFIDALTTEGVTFESVEVTPSVEDEMFLVTVKGDIDFGSNTVGSKNFICCGCKKEFYNK